MPVHYHEPYVDVWPKRASSSPEVCGQLRAMTDSLGQANRGGGGKNGENRGPGGWSVEGCLFWFLCSSQICVPPYSFLKRVFGELIYRFR